MKKLLQDLIPVLLLVGLNAITISAQTTAANEGNACTGQVLCDDGSCCPFGHVCYVSEGGFRGCCPEGMEIFE